MIYRENIYLLVMLGGLFALPIATNATPAPEKVERKPGEVVEVEIAPGVKMKFCWIPAGEAQLGSPKAERQEVLKMIKEAKEPAWLQLEAEEVRGKYKTKGFWLAKYSVTQGEWSALICATPSYFNPVFLNNAGITDTSRFPVDQVSWNDCRKLIDNLNRSVKRAATLGKGKFCLPHENEWEFAARGGRGNKQPFYFGNELNGEQANSKGDEPYGTATTGPFLNRTTEVGSYEKAAPHPWGLCDMTGNVFQWCENKYDDKSDLLVARGGSWGIDSWWCRSAHRHSRRPDYISAGIGCRICYRPD